MVMRDIPTFLVAVRHQGRSGESLATVPGSSTRLLSTADQAEAAHWAKAMSGRVLRVVVSVEATAPATAVATG
jgi:hypothetical protein